MFSRPFPILIALSVKENPKIVFSAQRRDFDCLRFSNRSAFWKLSVLGFVYFGWGGFICLDFCLWGFCLFKKPKYFLWINRGHKKRKRAEEIMAAELKVLKVRALGIVTLNIQLCVERCQV